MSFGDAGMHSLLPFGAATYEIARRAGMQVDEVDAVMLNKPERRSSLYLSAAYIKGAVDADGGVKTIRIPGANGKYVGNVKVKYTMPAVARHGEILTRFMEPDLLATLEINECGVPLGGDDLENYRQSQAVMRDIQNTLGAHGTTEFGIHLENKVSAEYKAQMVQPTLKRRPVVHGGALAFNVVGPPLTKPMNTLAGDCDFIYKRQLPLLGNIVPKEVDLWQCMNNDFCRTLQLWPCQWDALVRLRIHPLHAAILCNRNATPVPAAGQPVGAAQAHADHAVADFTALPNDASIVIEWDERTVSQPQYQQIIDAVIGKEYAFPGFTIVADKVEVLAGAHEMTARLKVGTGDVHWAMVSLQPTGRDDYLPGNGLFMSKAKFGGLDASMDDVVNARSERNDAARQQRFEYCHAIFPTTTLSEADMARTNLVIFPVGYGASTFGGAGSARTYHPTAVDQIRIDLRRPDAHNAATLYIGAGKTQPVVLCGVNTQTPHLKMTVKI